MLTLNRNDCDTLWDHLLPEGTRVLPRAGVAGVAGPGRRSSCGLRVLDQSI
jgi:hypothetical protein